MKHNQIEVYHLFDFENINTDKLNEIQKNIDNKNYNIKNNSSKENFKISYNDPIDLYDYLFEREINENNINIINNIFDLYQKNVIETLLTNFKLKNLEIDNNFKIKFTKYHTPAKISFENIKIKGNFSINNYNLVMDSEISFQNIEINEALNLINLYDSSKKKAVYQISFENVKIVSIVFATNKIFEYKFDNQSKINEFIINGIKYKTIKKMDIFPSKFMNIDQFHDFIKKNPSYFQKMNHIEQLEIIKTNQSFEPIDNFEVIYSKLDITNKINALINIYINQLSYFDADGKRIFFNENDKDIFNSVISLLLDKNIKTDIDLLNNLEKILYSKNSESMFQKYLYENIKEIKKNLTIDNEQNRWDDLKKNNRSKKTDQKEINGFIPLYKSSSGASSYNDSRIMIKKITGPIKDNNKHKNDLENYKYSNLWLLKLTNILDAGIYDNKINNSKDITFLDKKISDIVSIFYEKNNKFYKTYKTRFVNKDNGVFVKFYNNFISFEEYKDKYKNEIFAKKKLESKDIFKLYLVNFIIRNADFRDANICTIKSNDKYNLRSFDFDSININDDKTYFNTFIKSLKESNFQEIKNLLYKAPFHSVFNKKFSINKEISDEESKDVLIETFKNIDVALSQIDKIKTNNKNLSSYFLEMKDFLLQAKEIIDHKEIYHDKNKKKSEFIIKSSEVAFDPKKQYHRSRSQTL
jgi:hypothetical protein